MRRRLPTTRCLSVAAFAISLFFAIAPACFAARYDTLMPSDDEPSCRVPQKASFTAADACVMPLARRLSRRSPAAQKIGRLPKED